jgi:hypothetical protein
MTANSDILNQIAALPGDWHGAGCLSGDVIKAIKSYSDQKPFEASLETGVGKSTLILSHCSKKHYAFAADFGGSVTRTRNSELLNAGSVIFIEGLCQKTIPAHDFPEKLDFALIDGGHGYPFPELDYYFIYPHLRPGAILAVDDIHIPTIHNMFAVLKEDEMFDLDRIVGTTAFFRRTHSETFDPLGDGWWLQGYNQKYYPAPIIDETGKMVQYTSPGNKIPL